MFPIHNPPAASIKTGEIMLSIFSYENKKLKHILPYCHQEEVLYFLYLLWGSHDFW